MIKKHISTQVRIYKADVAKKYKEVVLYTSKDIIGITKHQKETCKKICGYLITINADEDAFSSIEVYTKKVLGLFNDRKVYTDDHLIFNKELNLLAYIKEENEDIDEPNKLIAVFMLPILGNETKGISTEISAESLEDLLLFNEFADEVASESEPSPYIFQAIEDRAVFIKQKELHNAIDLEYTLKPKDSHRLEEAKKLARTLSMYIMGKRGRGKTARPRKRLSKRDVYSDDITKIYIDKKGLKDYGEFERKANIVLDCSGSMSDVFEDAKLFIEAVNLIPNIKGKIILTASSGSIDFEMPVSHKTISSFICQSGAEGIKATLIKYEEDIKDADITIVLTDGDIVDGLPTEAFKERYKDKLVGSLISKGTEHLRTSLRRHFEEIMVAETPKDLIDTIMSRGKLTENGRDFTRSVLGLG